MSWYFGKQKAVPFTDSDLEELGSFTCEGEDEPYFRARCGYIFKEYVPLADLPAWIESTYEGFGGHFHGDVHLDWVRNDRVLHFTARQFEDFVDSMPDNLRDGHYAASSWTVSIDEGPNYKWDSIDYYFTII